MNDMQISINAEFSVSDDITASVSVDDSFSAEFNGEELSEVSNISIAEDISAQINCDEEFIADFGNTEFVEVSNVPAYTGDYRVLPKFREQTLETQGKRMRENVVVTQVPVYHMKNSDGSTTVYIADEVYH